jgi:uroporphyrinogen decarboxylase
MKSRERLLTVMKGGIPDCVPVAPDFPNMIPARMGNCDLAELKRLYGTKLVLKGNLHTTNVMLRSTPADVVAAGRKAIDDAAVGGSFILSTGYQCGRDTLDENLIAMIETARTYGSYGGTR